MHEARRRGAFVAVVYCAGITSAASLIYSANRAYVVCRKLINFRSSCAGETHSTVLQNILLNNVEGWMEWRVDVSLYLSEKPQHVIVTIIFNFLGKCVSFI